MNHIVDVIPEKSGIELEKHDCGFHLVNSLEDDISGHSYMKDIDDEIAAIDTYINQSKSSVILDLPRKPQQSISRTRKAKGRILMYRVFL